MVVEILSPGGLWLRISRTGAPSLELSLPSTSNTLELVIVANRSFHSHSHSDALADEGGGHLAWNLIIGAGSGCNHAISQWFFYDGRTYARHARQPPTASGARGPCVDVAPREPRVDRELYSFNGIFCDARFCREVERGHMPLPLLFAFWTARMRLYS